MSEAGFACRQTNHQIIKPLADGNADTPPIRMAGIAGGACVAAGKAGFDNPADGGGQ
ncbi:TPA: hypothetical protein ACFRG8_000803 [Neisseria lactamica]